MNSDWQRHVLASSGYLELGMLDDAALALEEIEPEDKTRNDVLGARVNLYIAAKKWDMAAAVASHLVKISLRRPVGGLVLAIRLGAPEALKGRSHFAQGRKHSSQRCGDCFQPGLLRQRAVPL